MQSSFSLFQFAKFVKFIGILVFLFNKYRYELCTCVKKEIYTCAQNFTTPGLITTCITYLQILVAEKLNKFNKFKTQF